MAGKKTYLPHQPLGLFEVGNEIGRRRHGEAYKSFQEAVKMHKASLFIALSLFLLLAAADSMAANYSGLWWDPSKGGQGISIIQTQDSICGAWYLYDESGQDMWLVFTGVLASANSLTTELFQYTGPPLGTSWDLSKLKAISRGTMTLTFNGPESASMHYNIGNISGTMNLEPFANDAAVMYWDLDKPGQGMGFFMEGLSVYVVWYLYDKNGHNIWVTSGTDLDITSTSGNLYKFSGPALGSAWDSSEVTSSIVGNGSIALSNSEEIPFTYNIEGVSGQLNLVPFVCNVSQCAGTKSATYEGTAPVTNSDDDQCGHFVQLTIVICDKSISGEAVDSFANSYFLQGTVDDSGNVSGTFYEEDDFQEEEPIGTFTGTLTGNTVSGLWQSEWGCYGTFNLEKTPTP